MYVQTDLKQEQIQWIDPEEYYSIFDISNGLDILTLLEIFRDENLKKELVLRGIIFEKPYAGNSLKIKGQFIPTLIDWCQELCITTDANKTNIVNPEAIYKIEEELRNIHTPEVEVYERFYSNFHISMNQLRTEGSKTAVVLEDILASLILEYKLNPTQCENIFTYMRETLFRHAITELRVKIDGELFFSEVKKKLKIMRDY